MRLLGAWPARLALGIKERFRANLKGEWSPSAGITPARAPWRLFTTHRSSLVPQSGGAAQQRRPAVLALARASSHARSTTVAPEVQGYWQELLDGVDKPTARKLVDFVDPAYPLGLAPAAEAGPVPGTARGRRKNPPVFFYFLETKRQHPTKVVLVRVGEFFEAVGIDAVLLVQHAGLNPMGAGNPPRAGCPRQNLRRTVADLVHAGLSVVVCEEVSEGYSYGYRRVNAKERYVAQVLTPATPHLLYGLVDEGTDVAFDSTPPLLGISMQVGGFMVVEVNVELFKVTVTQGLTEDAVHARLYEGGLSPPLFIHVPGGVGGREVSTVLAPWERRVATAFRSQAGSVERFTGADPVEGLVQRVRQLLSIPPDAKFTVVSSSVTDQPRPLYLSTAANLGLHSSRGVPPLLDYLLPPSTPSAARAWLCQLLLIPPPPSVGAAVLQACRQLSGVEVGVPIFPSLGVANVVLKLTQHEANDVFFRELASLCHSVGEACSCSDLEDFSDAVLAAACHSSGLSYPREELARACSEAFDAIGAVVEAEERLTGSGSSSLDEDEVPMLPGEPAHDALRRFQQANEGRFRGRVQNRCIPQQHQAVEAAWEEVEATAVDMMARVSAALGQGGGSANGARQVASARASQPCLAHNSVNNAVWLKVPRAAAAVHILKELGLGHPKDRMGNAEQGYYATREAEVAQDAYRRACAEAAEAVKAQLRRLAGKLQAHLSHLVTATMFATIATALVAHVSESRRRGWVLPQQRYPHDFRPGAPLPEEGQGAAGAGALEVRGMWPYWLDGASDQVVRNDVSMQGMFLLTGPNMAGKSTLLRSLCAVSLLAACGLAVPAGAAAVPYIDAFMLRNFSADSPVDGRSSFAVEMTEMRYVLGDVTPSSLVLVDELGKGTEVRAGAALAGAMLEQLASIACKGIFATHLHALLDMDLRLPGVELVCMEVERRPCQRRPGAVAEAEELVDGLSPTWRMVPGSSRESLALEVASACEVPAPVLRRAAELYHGMQVVTYTQGLPASKQLHQEQEGAQGEDGAGDPEAVAAAAAAAATPSQSGSTGGLQSLQEAGEVLQRTAAQVLANLLRTQEQEGSQAARQVAAAAAASAGSTDQWSQAAALGSSRSAASVEVAQATGVEAPGSGQPELQVHYVRKGQDPPPRTVGCACVYVVRREDGCFYVGSTDVLRQRIAAHRRRKPSSSSRVGGGPGIEVAYVLFLGDVGGASTARVVEAAAIQALQQQGFPLLSVADAQRRHVPRFS